MCLAACLICWVIAQELPTPQQNVVFVLSTAWQLVLVTGLACDARRLSQEKALTLLSFQSLVADMFHPGCVEENMSPVYFAEMSSKTY